MMSNKWKPIEGLSPKDSSIDLSDVDSVRTAWYEASQKLKESSPENLREFNERLARSWSIETGILERIYDVDRGTTLLLIEHGFVVDLVDKASTDKQPEELIQILRDHKAAADLIHDCVADNRPLTVGLIHDLHATLTRHQDTVEARDQFGKRVQVPLRKGAFKLQPNNPERENGTSHEYSPPVQVAAEMDRLLELYAKHQYENPILLASWLHHRFTQIHPYQDGNGRVARALTNLVLIKAGVFPVVVKRDDRAHYIACLEQADAGDLSALTRFFADIQKQTIVAALSVGPDLQLPQVNVVEAVGTSIAQRLRKRRVEKAQKLRGVNTVAERLQQFLREHLASVTETVKGRLNAEGGLHLGLQVVIGGPNILISEQPTEHWYRFQVIKAVEDLKHFIKFDENRYFVRVRLSEQDTAWLTFVVSFHHVGHELSGLMAAVAFAEFHHQSEEEAQPEFVKCMDQPFTFTYKDSADSLRYRLFDWADDCLAAAISKWGNLL
jgi:Fic family protein